MYLKRLLSSVSIALLVLGWFTLNGCKPKLEPEPYLSEIDGKEYKEDMSGEMSARKATRLLLEGKEVDYTSMLDIADSLESSDSTWRDMYFKAMNIVISEMDSAGLDYYGNAAFSYFLHYPDELLYHLNNEAFDNNEIWNHIISKQFQEAVIPEDITANSVINKAHANCKECSDETMELIMQFISMMDQF